MFSNILKKSKGFSMLELLIVVSVSGVILTMVVEIVMSGIRSSSEIEARVQVAELRGDIDLLLADPDNVTATFVGKVITDAGIGAETDIRILKQTDSGAVELFREAPAGDFTNGVRIDSIALWGAPVTNQKVFNHASINDKREFTLQVDYEYKKGTVTVIESQLIPIQVKVDLGTDAAIEGYATDSAADVIDRVCVSNGGTIVAGECVDSDGNSLNDLVEGNSSFIEQASDRISDLQQRVCMLENGVGAADPSCQFLGCGSSKTFDQCTTAGGSVISTGDGDLCLFSGSPILACPGGWSACTGANGQKWTTTTVNSCAVGCTSPVTVSPYTDVTTGSHAWGNLNRETVNYYDSTRCTTQTPTFNAADPTGSCSPCPPMLDKTGCQPCATANDVSDQAICAAGQTQIGCI